MSDTDRITELERQIAGLQSALDDVRGQLAQAELDQWRGRIDDLEVQSRLASMEATDVLNPLIDELRNRWLDAKASLSETTSTASEITDTLRKGLEQAMSDIRKAVLDAKSSVTG